jgi:hypothetical protein
VSLVTLEQLLHDAGFSRVIRRDEHFFQPLLVGINGLLADVGCSLTRPPAPIR